MTAIPLFFLNFFFNFSLISFRCHMMQIKWRLALNVPVERPKTGMFAFEKSAGKNMSCCLSSCEHSCTLKRTPYASIYGDLNLGLWRASEGGVWWGEEKKNRVVWKSRPQKECTPAWTPHGPTPKSALRLTYICVSVTGDNRFKWVKCS